MQEDSKLQVLKLESFEVGRNLEGGEIRRWMSPK